MAQGYPDPEVYNTTTKLLKYNADNYPHAVALREKDFGIWRELSWAGFNNRVRDIALALRARGLGEGDVVGLIGDNNIDWVSVEMAVHAIGAMSMGIYRDALDDEVGYLGEYAAVTAVYAEDQEQIDKFLNLGDRLPGLRHIIFSDPRGLRAVEDDRLVAIDELIKTGAELHVGEPGAYDAMVAATRGDAVCILCTTSGTTANPKLAMISHERFIGHNLRYLERDPKDSTDEYVSVLPMPWIMEQCYCLGFNLLARMKVSFPESQETAMADMREVGPTFLLMAPRVLEQIAADIRARVMDAGMATQWLFEKCVRAGIQAVEKGRRHTLADVLLFSALRDRLGLSRVRSAATGGAAMGPDTFKLFLAMGLPLQQLYGQTELMGAYTLTDVKTNDVDTVGIPFAGCDVRIDSPDQNGIGEVVSRHDNMFLGYYKNADATSADLRDGWMYTGDAGYFDDSQRLVVIDRIKDIAVMADGAKFSPQFLENKLKFSPYISEAVILGAGRDYLTAIICIRFTIVAKWAEKNRIPFTSYTNLSAQPDVYALIRQQILDVNSGLPEGQRIHKFMLLFKELDADDGELTRTRKVRRSVVAERYGSLIDAFYSDQSTGRIDTEVTLEDGRQTRLRADIEIMSVDSGMDDAGLKQAG